MNLSPYAAPIAFLVYLALAALLSLAGRALAGRSESSALQRSSYASGEAQPAGDAAPGYRPFFVIALFFAILHLGVLMLGSGGLNWMSGAYLIGLVLALVALILR